jgi:chloramphenicol O-acetyltransferase
MTNLLVAFRNFANAPKLKFTAISYCANTLNRSVAFPVYNHGSPNADGHANK